MIEEQPKEQKSFVDRVIAPTEEDERRAFEFFEELFEDKDLKKSERAKTPEETTEIVNINKAFEEFLKKYGVAHIKKIPPEKIRILDVDQLVNKLENNKDLQLYTGKYLPERQEIIIVPSESKLRMIKTIVHEMLHAQSFLSFGFDRSQHAQNAGYGGEISFRRAGMNVYQNESANDSHAMHALDEAVIEELAKEFYYTYIPAMQYVGEIFQEVNKRKEKVGIVNDDILDIRSKLLPDGEWLSTIWLFSYKKERNDLSDLINDIFESDTSGEFQSREDIFKLFVRAQMTGRLLPLGRVIKRVYGEGAFKFLGENTREIKKIR